MMDYIHILFILFIAIALLVAAGFFIAYISSHRQLDIIGGEPDIEKYMNPITGGGRRSKSARSNNVRLKDLKKHPRSHAEQFVINIFEKITGAKFPTAYPSWLKWEGRPMELDGYNDRLKIAVEFSGPQHTKYRPDNESYSEYWTRVQKDRTKIELCKKHNVQLIVVDMSVPQHLLYPYIHSRLFDIGVAKERPINYMPEYVAEPYENPELLNIPQL